MPCTLAPSCEGLWMDEGKARRILNLGARWRWVVSFTVRPFTAREGINEQGRPKCDRYKREVLYHEVQWIVQVTVDRPLPHRLYREDHRSCMLTTQCLGHILSLKSKSISWRPLWSHIRVGNSEARDAGSGDELQTCVSTEYNWPNLTLNDRR